MNSTEDEPVAVIALVATVPTLPNPVALPHSKKPTVIVYPSVSPETIVIPIVSCIIGFPLFALLVICCLRRRAKLARERDRRRTQNFDPDRSGISLARLGTMHRLGVYLAGPNGGRSRAVSLKGERGMGRGFPSLDLDTVVEERSEADPETTMIEVLTSPDS
ncbi:uncharacterized protein [Bemisia tabaci]|uniref:uncharacterized protein n=1 Tax=Bemisia tabaci TaxID=7038 RepID=UPI0008F9D406|nr:PREDICTED: uncharacterized protein LOC109043809 [Bemisia tabaci]XP_018916671.1 PREDICTED: uncharacterized protein LOC109043809 [Bemisia tabaci]XP_018916673.1 PREDICTED: uncharacterized protein LOC109043809 [Bemisia tabaci]XP_018916674.1 PREDICTED: uncharacterized protein LOC109043809 [Bemisia tabaci]